MGGLTRPQPRRRRLPVSRTTWLWLLEQIDMDSYPADGWPDDLNPFELLWLDCYGYGAELTPVREAWEAVRDLIIPKWIAERPGTRPQAWWLIDAPPMCAELRAPYDDWFLAPDLREPRRLSTGQHYTARAQGTPYYDHGRPRWAPASVVFETEADYLARHGLLTDAERAARA
jgi:hypothetical protein